MKAHLTLLALAMPVLRRPVPPIVRQDVTAGWRTKPFVPGRSQWRGCGLAARIAGGEDKYAEAKRSPAKESQDGDRMALQLAKQAEADAYATAKAQNTTQQTAARECKAAPRRQDEANAMLRSASSVKLNRKQIMNIRNSILSWLQPWRS
jgi:hypothetical protein